MGVEAAAWLSFYIITLTRLMAIVWRLFLAAFSVDFKDFALPFSWSFPPVIVPRVIVPRVIVGRFRADTGVCPYAVKFPDVGVLPRLLFCRV